MREIAIVHLNLSKIIKHLTNIRISGEVFNNRSTHIASTKDQGLLLRREVSKHLLVFFPKQNKFTTDL